MPKPNTDYLWHMLYNVLNLSFGSKAVKAHQELERAFVVWEQHQNAYLNRSQAEKDLHDKWRAYLTSVGIQR